VEVRHTTDQIFKLLLYPTAVNEQ